MRQIICLSESRWSTSPERTQHLLRLLDDVEIFYFELTHTDLLLQSWGQRSATGEREPCPGVHVFRAPPTLFHRQGTTVAEQRGLGRTAGYIRTQLQRHGVRNAVLWADTPLANLFLSKLAHTKLIYDCHRSWERYPLRMESELAYEADLVFAASPNLLTHVLPCNKNAFLLENGVNYTLFSKACGADVKEDGAMAALRHPVLSYVGDVTKSLRLEALIKTAKQHPEWSFVVVGRVSRRNGLYTNLKAQKNITCIGFRAPVDVPGCLAATDIGIDLLHNDILDEDVIPERIYAYFAAQKPVAALYPKRCTPKYEDVVYAAQTEESFENACLCAANELGRRKNMLRDQYARAADWKDRGKLLHQLLRENGMT